MCTLAYFLTSVCKFRCDTVSSFTITMLVSRNVMKVRMYNTSYLIRPLKGTLGAERSTCQSVQCNSNNNRPYHT
jgi:hypothetical protein